MNGPWVVVGCPTQSPPETNEMEKNMRRFLRLHSEHLVFLLLVAIAVVGRVDRIDWNFTPVAAAALFAGYYFRNRLIAAMVPLAALAISDFAELSHNNRGEMLTVWGAMLLPAMLGPWLREAKEKRTKIGRGLVCAFLPSAAFFLTTNLAVWVTAISGGMGAADYTATWAGLGVCYTAAIPFYFKMLSGDLFYMVVLFGAYSVATRSARETDEVVLASP